MSNKREVTYHGSFPAATTATEGHTMSAIERYDYESNGYITMEGTEDFIEVADLGEGGYSWSIFKAFYSPSARRYFWHGDSGCSCNGWEDKIENADSFENWNRASLVRAWGEFAKDYEYSITTGDYIDGLAVLNKFEVPA